MIKIFDLKYSNPRLMQAAQEITPTRVLGKNARTNVEKLNEDFSN